MRALRNILFLAAVTTILLICTWYIAIPDDLIRAQIDDAVSSLPQRGIRFDADVIKKGPFFTLHAENISLTSHELHILHITELEAQINPVYAFRKQIAASIEGRMGSGSISGYVMIPGDVHLRIDGASLDAIPYLTNIGIVGTGSLSGSFLKKDDTTTVVFEVPNLQILKYKDKTSPLLSTFHSLQGVLRINNETIHVDSIGIEGDKGYVRINGDISGGDANLLMELMPSSGALSPTELMLIEKYQRSPGHYVIPLREHF